MPRFFRRLAEGVFDEADVRRRALELGEFVEEARQRYGIAAPVAVGFSNGANIAAALLLLKPDAACRRDPAARDGAAVGSAQGELGGKPVLLLSGQADPIVPASNSAKLAALFTEAGASVTHQVLPAGHQLSQADVTLARDWIGNVAAKLLDPKRRRGRPRRRTQYFRKTTPCTVGGGSKINGLRVQPMSV